MDTVDKKLINQKGQQTTLEVTKPFEVVQILANLCSKEDINLLEAMKSLDNEHFKKDVFRNLNEFTFV